MNLDRFWQSLAEGVAIQDLAESMLSADEREALENFHNRYEEELASRGGDFSDPDEENMIVDALLNSIQGAKAAFDRRSLLETQIRAKSASSAKHII